MTSVTEAWLQAKGAYIPSQAATLIQPLIMVMMLFISPPNDPQGLGMVKNNLKKDNGQ